jgi:hypothetical protein
MHRILGIAPLTIALASIAVPAVTLYIIWGALALATAAAFAGSRLFALSATLIDLANLALLNPSPWAALAWEPPDRCVWLKTITCVLFLSPVAAFVLSLGREGKKATASERRAGARR